MDTCGDHLKRVALLTTSLALNDADVTAGVMVMELAYRGAHSKVIAKTQDNSAGDGMVSPFGKPQA